MTNVVFVLFLKNRKSITPEYILHAKAIFKKKKGSELHDALDFKYILLPIFLLYIEFKKELATSINFHRCLTAFQIYKPKLTLVAFFSL